MCSNQALFIVRLTPVSSLDGLSSHRPESSLFFSLPNNGRFSMLHGDDTDGRTMEYKGIAHGTCSLTSLRIYHS